MFENLNFGKLGLKLVFLKNFASHTHAFCSYFSMLGGIYAKTGLFFSKLCFFWNFDRTRLFLDQSKLVQNIQVSLCLFRSIEPKILINRKSYKMFFKTRFSVESNTFSKSFLTFPFPYNSVKVQFQFFVIFYHSFCKVFLSQGQYVLFTLPFAFYFMFSCKNSWFLGKFSNLCKFGIFDDSSHIF